MSAAFYCMSSELYFPGCVGLINSLRLVGHTEPIYVLDCGLEPGHRALLEREATVVDGDPGVEPYLLKTVAPTRHPSETMVLIDVDMVATRPLTPMIEAAAAGRVIAVDDNIDRFLPEWGELLGLGELERRPYVSSGLVVLGGAPGEDVLRLWDERQHLADPERSYFGADEEGYPFRFLDQDILNAVIAAATEPGQLIVEEPRIAPHQPYRGLRVVDERTLRCTYRDGFEPYVLHQYLEKPWVKPMYHGAYSRLLRRLWLGGDVALPFPRDEVPRRLRTGPRALAERKLVGWADLIRWYARDVIPERLGTRRAER